MPLNFIEIKNTEKREQVCLYREEHREKKKETEENELIFQ